MASATCAEVCSSGDREGVACVRGTTPGGVRIGRCWDVTPMRATASGEACVGHANGPAQAGRSTTYYGDPGVKARVSMLGTKRCL